MAANIVAFKHKHWPEIEVELTRFLTENTNESELLASMLYSLSAGGKRLRPLLLLATLDYFDAPLSRGAYQVAGALEMIHIYSLIHDDLPAMDDDDLRRGKPTNHIVYGEALAILAGDGLLTEAFHLVSQSQLPATEKICCLQKLAQGAGTSGMIAGQVADIAAEKQKLALLDIQSIHQRKTGALIEFAVEIGTMLANQSAEVAAQMARYAQHFGIAFQIKDDLLDVLGDEASLGKKTGGDQAHQKSTYTSLLGVAGAQAALTDHHRQALAALDKVTELRGISAKSDLLVALINTLMV